MHPRGILIRKDYLIRMFTNYLLKSNIPCLFFRVISNTTSHLHDLSKKIFASVEGFYIRFGKQ